MELVRWSLPSVLIWVLSGGVGIAQPILAQGQRVQEQSGRPAQGGQPAPQDQPSSVSVSTLDPGAAELLAKASKIHESSKGRKGPRRLQILHEAIEAYEQVGQEWPSAYAERAVAAFRRGEIHRALAELGAARGAFEEVLEVTKKNPDLHVRALLELGHMDRREERWRDCVIRYRQAVKFSGASLRFQNDAREWIVKVHLTTMAWTSASLEAERWLEFCEGPVEEIQALDLQLRALIGARQLRLAREQLLDLQERMAILAAAPTAEGRRITRALEQMKAPKALKLARQNGR